MRTGLLGVLLLVVFPAVIAAEPADEQRLAYDIEAVVDLDCGHVRGRAALAIPASALAASGEVHLDPYSAGEHEDGKGRMKVRRITDSRSGQTLKWAERDRLLRVEFNESDSEEGGARITVEYEVPLDESAREEFGYYIFMGHEAGSLWYPDVVGRDGERPHFRDFRVTLSLPERYTILTSGAPVGEPIMEGATRRMQYVAEHVEGFAVSFGEGYVLTTVTDGDQEIVAFSSPDRAETFRQVAELAAEAVAWFRKSYGFFPVQRVGILQGHPRWSGGFPLPNVFWIHQGTLRPEFLRWIVAHELGHYYWGLYVLGDEERLDWLQLANGIWADQLYMAETSGRSLEEQWRSRGAINWLENYVRAMVGNHEQRLGLTHGDFDFDYDTLVRHGKAATGLYLQSRLLGADSFLELQRQLIADYRDRPLPVKDFIARLEAAGLEHAEEFFETWQRRDATLGFDVTVGKTSRSEAGWTYEISVQRTGTVRYPVVIEAVDVDGGTVRRELAGREEEEALSIELQAPLRLVLVDPEGALPMWSSSHPGIQRVFLHAMDLENLMEPFFRFADSYLASNPDDHEVRALLAARLLAAGRYPSVVSLLESLPKGSCEDRDRCRSALTLARALAQVGEYDSALSLLDAVEGDAERLDLKAAYRRAREEVEALAPGD